MEDLKKEVEDLDSRVRNLEEEVAENRKGWQLISVIKDLLTDVKESTARTEENVKELRKDIEYDKQEIEKLKDQRNQDHYVKPLDKKERLVEQALTSIILLVIGALAGAILSNIGL